MKTPIEGLQDAVDIVSTVAGPIVSRQGIDATAIALVKVALELLLKTHPKPEIVLWFRHQADLLDKSDRPSAGGTA